MATLYSAKRRDFKQNHRSFMHHVAWGIVCVILIACVGGMWAYAQSLTTKAESLEQQLLAAQQQPTTSTCRVNGEWLANTTKVQNIDGRQYRVHLPASYVANDYAPLVIFYPGKGASAEAAQAAYNLDTLPAIVVYPHPTVGTDGYNAWQGAPYSSGSDDVSFTQSILDELQSDLCIDRTKVYAVGLSNGGGFVSLLSCKLPDRFAAFAIVAGAMYSPDGQCMTPEPTPLISIHGDQDPIVPYAGSPLRRLPPIDTWSAKRAAMNKCEKPTTTTVGLNTAVTTWDLCQDNATIQNVRIQGGGHVWGDTTNDTIWQFLSRFSL